MKEYEYSLVHFRMTRTFWKRIEVRPRLMKLEWCSNTAGGRVLWAEEPIRRMQLQLQAQELQLEKEGECP